MCLYLKRMFEISTRVLFVPPSRTFFLPAGYLIWPNASLDNTFAIPYQNTWSDF